MPIKDPEKRKAYHRKYMAEYLKDPEKRKAHLKRIARNNKKARERCREVIRAFKAAGCLVCGESHLACLVAHHLDPAKKEFSLGASTSWVSERKVRRELAKCLCLCMNCHAKHHAGDLELPQGGKAPGLGS